MLQHLCIRKNIYIPLIVDIKGNWGGGNEQVIDMISNINRLLGDPLRVNEI